MSLKLEHQQSKIISNSSTNRDAWQLTEIFYSETDMLNYFSNRVPRNAITHRNKCKCTECKNTRENLAENEIEKHKMVVFYRSCTSKTCTSRCSVKYKVLFCQARGVYNCFMLGIHSTQQMASKLLSTKNNSANNPEDLRYGIDPKIKAYILELMSMRIFKSRSILSHLQKNRNMFNPKGQLPSVHQIQGFVSRKMKKEELKNPPNNDYSGNDDEEESSDANSEQFTLDNLTNGSNNQDKELDYDYDIMDSEDNFISEPEAKSDSIAGDNGSFIINRKTSIFNKSQARIEDAIENVPSLNETVEAFKTIKSFLKSKIAGIELVISNLVNAEKYIIENFDKDCEKSTKIN